MYPSCSPQLLWAWFKVICNSAVLMSFAIFYFTIFHPVKHAIDNQRFINASNELIECIRDGQELSPQNSLPVSYGLVIWRYKDHRQRYQPWGYEKYEPYRKLIAEFDELAPKLLSDALAELRQLVSDGGQLLLKKFEKSGYDVLARFANHFQRYEAWGFENDKPYRTLMRTATKIKAKLEHNAENVATPLLENALNAVTSDPQNTNLYSELAAHVIERHPANAELVALANKIIKATQSTTHNE